MEVVPLEPLKFNPVPSLAKLLLKVKSLEAITLTSNHRNEIVEDLRDYYMDNPIY